MKKLIALLLVLTMALGLFAGCNENPNDGTTDAAATLEDAKAYLAAMYREEEGLIKGDLPRVTVVMIAGTKFTVAWTTDATEDKVKITANETMATVDVNEDTDEDFEFTLTATITDADGKTASVTFKHSVRCTKVEVEDGKVVLHFPEGNQYVTEEVFEYTSSSGSKKNELVLTDSKDAAVVLTLRENDDKSVTFITDSGKYLFCDGNSVEFAAEEGEFTKFFLEATDGGQFIKSNACYQDNPEKPQYLEVYSGYLTCYGMNLDKANIYTFKLDPVTTVSQSAILDAAYALAEDGTLNGTFTLTGVIDKINTPWSSDYKNITVTIVCDGDTARPVQCYRLAGEGAEFLAVGDTVTVTGTIKNYKGTVEFDAGCSLDKVVKGEGNENPDPTDPTDPVTPSEQPAYVAAPEVGKTYKMGLWQEKKGEVNYFTGVMKGFYGDTSTDKAAGVDVTLEDAGDGAYYITFTVDGVKNYVGTEVNGTHLNFKIMDEANRATFTWDAEHGTLLTVMSDGTDAFMGTYGDYFTVGMSALDKIDTSYPVHLYE